MKDNLEKILGFVIDVNFSSHEEMSEMSKLWELEQIQIEKGSFKGSLHGVHTPHIQLSKAIRSHGVIVKGKTPENSYTFSYVNGIGEITHNGLPLTSNELLVLDDNDKVDFTANGSSYDITIAIDKDFFQKIYKELFGVTFTYDRNKNRIELTKTKDHNIYDDSERWRIFLTKHLDEWIHDSALTEQIEKRIIETLCSHMGVVKDKKILSSEKNAIALHQYIDKHYREDMTIKEICDILKISERGVRPSFKKIFGFNPKEYLSRYRLGKFRNSLIKNSDDKPSISIIGSEEGLFHQSRLSKEYKEMFGYLPSDITGKEKTDS